MQQFLEKLQLIWYQAHDDHINEYLDLNFVCWQQSVWTSHHRDIPASVDVTLTVLASSFFHQESKTSAALVLIVQLIGVLVRGADTQSSSCVSGTEGKLLATRETKK